MGTVQSVLNLQHLECLLEVAGSSVVVLGLYSRVCDSSSAVYGVHIIHTSRIYAQSCGVCKAVLAEYKTMALEAGYQRAGLRFLTHDVRNEFDEVSDIARMYKARTVPRFLFFVDGAVVHSVAMTDTRHGVPAQTVNLLVARDVKRLRAAIRELLLRTTPSARR